MPNIPKEMMIGFMTAQPPVKEELEAFLQATAELRPVVRAVIASMLNESREHPDVEDCTHEALRRAMEGRDRWRSGEPLRPWVTGIARHVALDALRARKRDRQRVARNDDNDDEDAPSAVDRLADGGPSAFDRVATAERDRALQRALARLPEGQREALRLFHLEGLGYQQIATRLGVPLGTVATWVNRARKAVTAAVQQESAPDSRRSA
jgi:RNA polymerase sigma-70 factor (ECF subfamily)